MAKKKTTQKDRVLDYINQFGSISSFQAYADLGVTQLGARIFELKEAGYEFAHDWETRTNRFGDEVKFKRYRFAAPVQPQQASLFEEEI